VLQAQFSLTQMIGDPSATTGQLETIACVDINGEASAITEIAFDYDDDNILTSLAIRCDTLP